MQIPYSDKVNTIKLARLFDNKSESYKLFWFKAILHEVSMGRSEMTFRDLIERMIVDAWYMVSEYKLNLGPSDTLEKTVLHISETTDFSSTMKEEELLEYLRESKDKELRKHMNTLALNVPYRLQAPLIENPGTKIWHKIDLIIEYINKQEGTIYRIQRDKSFYSTITIKPEWMDYIQSNLGILIGWTDYNLIIYLQRRNPTVPGIASKIYPPQERKLTEVTKFWKYIIKNSPVIDIYTEEILSPVGVSIDHFVPWSYVASDELWNLIPTVRSVNSSKSNNLPDWDRYFGSLAKAEYDAYKLTCSDENAMALFNKCKKENLNNPEITMRLYKPDQDIVHFENQLKEIMLPIYESAINMGFNKWVYTNE